MRLGLGYMSMPQRKILWAEKYPFMRELHLRPDTSPTVILMH